MLAIKTILSAADRIPILVFDEVDAGVGGRVGGVLGQKLWGLSKSHQVLCVTHLPQIACYADLHAKVVKLDSDDRTATLVESLSDEARVTELSQMLGSDSGRNPQQRPRDAGAGGNVEGKSPTVHLT